MEQHAKNKEFILNYLNELRGVAKTRPFLEKFMADEVLIGHIEFFEKAFPFYDVIADEMTAECNRVILKARVMGTHTGDLGGIPPTFKEVNFPFAISYEIENNMIVNHWMIADQMSLMEQLGVVQGAEAAH
ncbi:MAG: ester cyclase [Chitinophagaceae bacterium]